MASYSCSIFGLEYRHPHQFRDTLALRLGELEPIPKHRYPFTCACAEVTVWVEEYEDETRALFVALKRLIPDHPLFSSKGHPRFWGVFYLELQEACRNLLYFWWERKEGEGELWGENYWKADQEIPCPLGPPEEEVRKCRRFIGMPIFLKHQGDWKEWSPMWLTTECWTNLLECRDCMATPSQQCPQRQLCSGIACLFHQHGLVEHGLARLQA